MSLLIRRAHMQIGLGVNWSEWPEPCYFRVPVLIPSNPSTEPNFVSTLLLHLHISGSGRLHCSRPIATPFPSSLIELSAAAPMGTPSSAISAKFGCTARPNLNSWKGSRVSGRSLVSMGTTTTTRRSPRFRVCCAAKPEMVSKVMEIVKQQLALKDDAKLTPESKFTEFGADSLDTVEIVMALEEEFKITVEEDNAQSITTIQEAADLIDKLVAEAGKAA